MAFPIRGCRNCTVLGAIFGTAKLSKQPFTADSLPFSVNLLSKRQRFAWNGSGDYNREFPRGIKMRNILLLTSCMAIAASFAVAQDTASKIDAPSKDKVVMSGQTTMLRIMDPAEKVAVNGRVVRVADLMPLLSLDNAWALHLRIPEMRTHGLTLPTLPAESRNQLGRSGREAEGAAVHANAPSSTTSPNPKTIPPQSR